MATSDPVKFTRRGSLLSSETLDRINSEQIAEKKTLKAAIFPKDRVSDEGEDRRDDEEVRAAAVLAAAKEAARLEKLRYIADLKYRRARLESDYLLKCGARSKQHGRRDVDDDASVALAFLDSFDDIVEMSNADENNNNQIENLAQGFLSKSSLTSPPIKTTTTTATSTKNNNIGKKSATASSLKEMANAQQRKRIAKRRELERDATLSFLASR